MGKLVGPTGRVLSIEPDGANLERLKANLALNGIDNADLLEQPVTDKPGEVTFFINSDNSGGNALWDPGEFAGNPKSRANPQPQRLAATTLDAAAARLKLATPRLIKIDTEGAEQRVLEGARGLLEGCRVPFVIAELHEFGLQKMGGSGASLRALMEGFGYSTFALYYDGALPKFVPRETALAMRVISSVLFSTPEQVASCWPSTLFDPAQVHDPAFS
jgi:FkbM family methyltransferase